MLHRGIAALGTTLSVILAPTAAAQPAPSPTKSPATTDRFDAFFTEASGTYRITFDKEHGTPLTDYVDLAQALTGKTFDFDANSCGAVRLNCRGTMTIPKDRFWSSFQSVLKAYDFVIVPYGHVTAPGQPADGPETGLFAIRRSSGGAGGAKPGYIKSQAPIVRPEDLSEYRHDPGIVLTTSFQLEHVNCQEVVNMLQTYFTDPMLESVRAVNGSNTIVATGFAQTLAGLSGLVAQIDVEPTTLAASLERIPLRHAVAQEILPILHDFTNTATAAQPRPAGPTPYPVAPTPRIDSDPRTNAVLVLAAPDDLSRIRGYVKALDVAVDATNAIENTRVRALRHAPAAELVQTLLQWARLNGLTGGGAGTPVHFVADLRTNSLLVTCSPDQWKPIEALVSRLDTASSD